MASIDISHLSAFQKGIVEEATKLGSGTLWVPMGVGKTRLAITLSLMNTEEDPKKRPGLFIVAKSLISEWTKEIETVFKDVKYLVIHQDLHDDILEFDSTKVHIVITTPEVITKHYKVHNVQDSCIEEVANMVNGRNMGVKIRYRKLVAPVERKSPIFGTEWGTLALDEAQKYLNPNTLRTRAILGVYAKRKWLLSGTPLSEAKMGNVFGYHLLLDLETPRTRPDFKLLFKSPAYKGLRYTLVYREKNDDYIPEDLGQEIISKIVPHGLYKEEIVFYESIKTVIQVIYAQLQAYKELKEKPKKLKEEIKKIRGMLLSMISYLRQALICPVIPISSMYITMSTFETREEITDSFTRELVKVNRGWLDNESAVFSSRYRKVVEIIEAHPNQRTVIFSDYRTTLDCLEHYIPKNRKVYSIQGEDKIEKRGKTIQDWEESNGGIFLLTYSIGSCGLNLQKGEVVIVMDYGWNIDVTKQAISRVVRRGQTSSRICLYYLTSNTGIEECIYKLHESKKEVSTAVLDGEGDKTIKKSIAMKDIIRFLDEKDNCVILERNL